MAMTTCKECEKPVSTDAKTCPHCGTSAPAKKKAKGGIGKWLLIVFAIGLVAMILPKQDKATTAASAPPKAQAKAAPQEKPIVSTPNTDRCYETGKAMAVVYRANFTQMASVDLSSSEMMRQGCEKTAKEQGTGDACMRACESGFEWASSR